MPPRTRTMINVRTGQTRTIELPNRGQSERWPSALYPFAPRDGDPPMDDETFPRSATLGGEREHSNLDDLEGMDLAKSWADPRINPTPWKRNILGTAQHTAAPTDGNGSGGGGTDPDLTTEPYLFKGGPETSAIIIMLKAPPSGAATFLGAGFTVTVWVRDPGTHLWGATQPFTSAYDVVTGTGDFNGGELFFQITNVNAAGNIIALVKEQY